jgi:hypothetical protein
VALERTDVPEERSASIIRVTRIDEHRRRQFSSNFNKNNVVPSSPILVTMIVEELRNLDVSCKQCKQNISNRAAEALTVSVILSFSFAT